MSDFQHALKKLSEDPQYGEAVIKDPSRLTKDFAKLDPTEMLLLMQAWHASGDSRAAFNILTICHCCTSSASAR
jgi:hypothetical protein